MSLQSIPLGRRSSSFGALASSSNVNSPRMMVTLQSALKIKKEGSIRMNSVNIKNVTSKMKKIQTPTLHHIAQISVDLR
jgi:hypothetical protein